MCHGTLYLLKLCITFQLDHCTVYVELHDVVRISEQAAKNCPEHRRQQQQFCQKLIQSSGMTTLCHRGVTVQDILGQM